MRIFLITADKPFYIPIFLTEFLGNFEGDLVGTAFLPPHPRKMSFRKYVHKHYKMYGLRPFLKMGIRYFRRRYLHPFLRRLGFDRPPSAKSLLEECGCPIFEPENVNSADFIETIADFDIDLVVSVAASQIFKKRILNLPRLSCINVHGSLLPKHRGINPSFWVLLEGDKQTGVSVHFMDEKIDTGGLILQNCVPVADDETLDSLSEKIAVEGAHALIEALRMIEAEKVEDITVQQEGDSSYHSFPTKEDGKRFREKGLKFV